MSYRLLEAMPREDGKADLRLAARDGTGTAIVYGVDWNTAVFNDFEGMPERGFEVTFSYDFAAHSAHSGSIPTNRVDRPTVET